MAIVQAAFIIFIPALALFLAMRIKLVGWLGPVVICYLCGIFMGNLPWDIQTKVVNDFTEITIVLALPLLLFSADVKSWFRLARTTILSFVLMIVSALMSAGITYWLLGDRVADSWKIAGMLVGMYSGGTVNTSAIGKALGVNNEFFVMVTSADLVLGGVYLLFILSFGQRVCLKFLPAFQEQPEVEEDIEEVKHIEPEKNHFAGLSKLAQMGLAVLLCIVIAAASAGGALLVFGRLHPTAVILSLTTLGLVASLWRPVRQLAWSYEAGDYLLLMFCVAIGMLVNFQKMFASSVLLTFLGFAFCLMFGAIVLHMILAAIFRIDADTTLITSVAGIFGPPFIGPVASALKNRTVLVSGLTMSIAGIALGTQIGLLFAALLRYFGAGT